jgi:Family of unknown function (DUF5677)
MTTALQTRLRQAEALLKSLKPSDSTGKALAQVLSESCDVAKAEVQVLDATLPSSAAVLSRALLERMMLSKWIVTRDTYAERYLTLGKIEVMRQMRKLLTKKRFFARDRKTGEDRTETLLADPKLKSLDRCRIEDVAKQAELEDIYDIFYGFLSMPSHGSTYGLPITMPDVLKMARDVSVSSLHVITKITSEYTERGHRLTRSEVRQILFP